MKKLMNRSVLVLVSMVLIQSALAQSDNAKEEGEDFITSIARYPRELRTSILNVSKYPQVLIKLERIQAKSSQSFQDLMDDFPRDKQEKFYEASRYPDRVNYLVSNGKKNDLEVYKYLEDLPIDTRSSFMDVYNNHFDVLVKMNKVYRSSEDAMNRLLDDYPLHVQSDFRKVIARPDVMHLLTENIDMTVSLGQDFQEQPEDVIAHLDSINSALAVQDASLLEEYKAKVENDPELQKEMMNASENFSTSYSYGANNQAQPAVVNNYYSYYNDYNPYPYWFSYPYWYATPIWYPVPYYYYTGFYYGPYGRIVVCGLPSWPYTNWFYSYGYRRYTYIYGHCNTYYHRNYRIVRDAGPYRGSRWSSTQGRSSSNHVNGRWQDHYKQREGRINTTYTNSNSENLGTQGRNRKEAKSWNNRGKQQSGGSQSSTWQSMTSNDNSQVYSPGNRSSRQQTESRSSGTSQKSLSNIGQTSGGTVYNGGSPSRGSNNSGGNLSGVSRSGNNSSGNSSGGRQFSGGGGGGGGTPSRSSVSNGSGGGGRTMGGGNSGNSGGGGGSRTSGKGRSR